MCDYKQGPIYIYEIFSGLRMARTRMSKNLRTHLTYHNPSKITLQDLYHSCVWISVNDNLFVFWNIHWCYSFLPIITNMFVKWRNGKVSDCSDFDTFASPSYQFDTEWVLFQCQNKRLRSSQILSWPFSLVSM